MILHWYSTPKLDIVKNEPLVYLQWSTTSGRSEKGTGQSGQRPQQSPLHSPYPVLLLVWPYTTLLLSSPLSPPPILPRPHLHRCPRHKPSSPPHHKQAVSWHCRALKGNIALEWICTLEVATSPGSMFGEIAGSPKQPTGWPAWPMPSVAEDKTSQCHCDQSIVQTQWQ